MKALRCCAPALLLVALSVTNARSAGNSPRVGNPIFSNIPIQCGSGYAYEASPGQGCSSPNGPSQNFNGAEGMAWSLIPHGAQGPGTGLTGPNTGFNPPSFSGLPFTVAAFLQSSNSEVTQVIPGFVTGKQYVLSFYLGSRYSGANDDGNQTVVAAIDNQVIGSWSVVSFTPFQIRTTIFAVAVSGPHTLKFIGTRPGDHTAFFSGVSIQALN